MNDSKNEAGFRIEVSRVSLPQLQGGVMIDHEYGAVFRISRLGSLLFSSKVGQ